MRTAYLILCLDIERKIVRAIERAQERQEVFPWYRDLFPAAVNEKEEVGRISGVRSKRNADVGREGCYAQFVDWVQAGRTKVMRRIPGWVGSGAKDVPRMMKFARMARKRTTVMNIGPAIISSRKWVSRERETMRGRSGGLPKWPGSRLRIMVIRCW